jgi:hypothetical protein
LERAHAHATHGTTSFITPASRCTAAGRLLCSAQRNAPSRARRRAPPAGPPLSRHPRLRRCCLCRCHCCFPCPRPPGQPRAPQAAPRAGKAARAATAAAPPCTCTRAHGGIAKKRASPPPAPAPPAAVKLTTDKQKQRSTCGSAAAPVLQGTLRPQSRARRHPRTNRLAPQCSSRGRPGARRPGRCRKRVPGAAAAPAGARPG